MSVFYNQKQLDLVGQFASFVDLVTNPEKFSALVAEAKKVQEDLKKYTEARVKLDKIDELVAKADEDLNLKRNKLDSDKAVVLAYEEKTKQTLAAKELALEEKDNAVQVRLEAAAKREKELNTKEEYLHSLGKDLLNLRTNLEKNKDDLVVREKALLEKEAKLKALLG